MIISLVSLLFMTCSVSQAHLTSGSWKPARGLCKKRCVFFLYNTVKQAADSSLT